MNRMVPAPVEIPLRTIRRGRIHTFDVRGRPVIVFWARDQLVVALEVCPHLGGPLADAQLVDDGCALRCPWHGYKFDTLSGEFLENPNLQYVQRRLTTAYQTYKPGQPGFKLHLVPHEIRDGMLLV